MVREIFHVLDCISTQARFAGGAGTVLADLVVKAWAILRWPLFLCLKTEGVRSVWLWLEGLVCPGSQWRVLSPGVCWRLIYCLSLRTPDPYIWKTSLQKLLRRRTFWSCALKMNWSFKTWMEKIVISNFQVLWEVGDLDLLLGTNHFFYQGHFFRLLVVKRKSKTKKQSKNKTPPKV